MPRKNWPNVPIACIYVHLNKAQIVFFGLGHHLWVGAHDWSASHFHFCITTFTPLVHHFMYAIVAHHPMSSFKSENQKSPHTFSWLLQSDHSSLLLVKDHCCFVHDRRCAMQDPCCRFSSKKNMWLKNLLWCGSLN